MADQNQTPTVTTTTSKQFRLNLPDLIQSLIYAGIGAVASPLLTYLESNNFSFNLKDMWHVAIVALVTSALRKYVKPSQTILKITPPLKANDDDGSGNNGGIGTETPPKPPGTP